MNCGAALRAGSAHKQPAYSRENFLGRYLPPELMSTLEDALDRLKKVLPGEAPQLMTARLDAVRVLGREVREAGSGR